MAARSLGSLTVDLIVKMGGFKQGMDASARQAQDLERRLSKSFRGIGDSFGKLGALLGVGLGLEGLRRAGADAIEFGDNIEKAKAKTGLAAQDLSELAYVAKQSDVEFEALGTALKKMQVNLSEAASGAKAPNDALAALGLTIDDLKGKKADEQFEILADRIAALKDPSDRTRASVELFGKAGADLLPLFQDGAQGIRELRDEARRLGATLTDEQAKALADADDAIKRLKASFSGLSRTLVAEVAPSLSQFLDNINAIATGDAVGKLREQIDFLRRMQGRSFVSVGYGDIGTGFFTAAEGAQKLLELEKKLAEVEQQRQRSASVAPGGHSRVPFAPGYQPDPEKPDKAAAAAALREQEQALERLRKEYTDVYTDGVAAINDVATPTEQITARFEAQKATLEQLAQTYPAFADQASEALARAAVAADDELEALKRNTGAEEEYSRVLEDRQRVFEATRTDTERYTAQLEHLREVFQGSADQETYGRAVADAAGEYINASSAAEEYRKVLEELNKQLADGTLTQEAYDAATARAKEAFAKAGQEAGAAFRDEAKRGTQNLVADFLINFDTGSILQKFAQLFEQIAAEALAAKIADKLFSGLDAIIERIIGALGSSGGGGSSWIGTAVSAIGAFFGGKAEGGRITGPGTGTSDSIPIWASHGEYMVKARSVAQPGALPFLEDFNRRGMDALDDWQGFAEGGFVGRLPPAATPSVAGAQPVASLARPVVQLRNVNAFDTGVIRDYLLSSQGEEVMLNFVQRNGSRVRTAMTGA